MSGSTTFSYAQAAKGQTPVQTNATSTASSAQVDLQARDDASSVTTGADAAANTFSTTSEISESAKSSQVDMEVVGSKKSSEIATAEESGISVVSSKDESSYTARSDETLKANHQPTTSEKPARSSNRSGEPNDSKKGRKGRKARNSDKETDGDQAQQAQPEPEKPPVGVKLHEAPPPAVNVWEQRRLANTRQPANLASALTAAESSSKSASEVSTKRSSSAEGVGVQTIENARGPGNPPDGSRLPNDQSSRRNPRGSRLSDSVEQLATGNPPYVKDAALWPTPDDAAAEDSKRKTPSEPDQPSKEKQDDGSQNKTNPQKRVWKTLEVTPTVKFETQIAQQRTMNRARGGGQAGRNSVSRGGHASAAGVSSEKAQGAPEVPASKSAAESQGRLRDEVSPRTSSLQSEKMKRFSVDQREQRKYSVPATYRGSGISDEYPAASKPEASKASKSDVAQGSVGQYGSFSHGTEPGKKEGAYPGNKDGRPRRGAHGSGRGGHSGNQQSFITNGHGGRPNQFSPPPHTPNGYPAYGGPGSSRGGRGRPMTNGYKGFPNGSVKVPQMHSITTDVGAYPPYPQAPPYSAYPAYSPDFIGVAIVSFKSQIEYYFSKQNLAKDSFLKQNMDSQGFVPLDIIINFARVRSILAHFGQNMDFLREACSESREIDFVLGDGDKEFLRRREGWKDYVFPEELRQERARTSGPTTILYRSKHSLHLNPAYPSQASLPYSSYSAISPPAFGAPFSTEIYPGYQSGPSFHAAVNGATVNGTPSNGTPVNEQSFAEEPQLNAAVPEFAPGKLSPNGVNGITAQAPGGWVDEALQAATTLSDEQLPDLQVVVHKDSGKLPNGTTGNSTVSEGPDSVGTNGVQAGPNVLNTPEVGPVSEQMSSPGYWSLDGKLAQVSDGNNMEKYADFRARALELRQAAKPGEVPDEMKQLYKFYSHVLVTKFNPGMYKEFRQYALEDATAEAPSKSGLSNLLQFYRRLLSAGQDETDFIKVMRQHYDDAQNLAGSSSSSEEQV